MEMNQVIMIQGLEEWKSREDLGFQSPISNRPRAGQMNVLTLLDWVPFCGALGLSLSLLSKMPRKVREESELFLSTAFPGNLHAAQSILSTLQHLQAAVSDYLSIKEIRGYNL